jgi:molybdate transport system regulatory protein
MRNQWPCVVESVERLGPIARCICRRPSRERWPCRWHRASPQRAPSCWACSLAGPVALCKATAVRAMPYAESPAAGVNWWEGRVTRLSRGPEVDEVAAQPDAGVQMVGFAPTGSGLRVRSGSSCRWMNRRWCWRCGIEGWAAGGFARF